MPESTKEDRPDRIAVVIPSYRVKAQILDVIAAIGPECRAIFVVDDECPEGTGKHVAAHCTDPRVKVVSHNANQGVGGATLSGYRAALDDGADVIVKLDGDGQMDPAMIPRLVRPILKGEADYTKGNRFFELSGLQSMPLIRLIGNSLLSFASKLSSGYWNLFDPTNGFTAIQGAVARALPLDRINHRWFFESDMLFQLGILRAVVVDVPMPAFYADERSSMVIRRVVPEFAMRHMVNTVKRLFYNYYLRNFNIASIEIAAGLVALVFGTVVGSVHWIKVTQRGVPTTSGTVMLAALPIIIGVQLVLAFLTYDLQNVPRDVLHSRLDWAGPGHARLGPAKLHKAAGGAEPE